MKPLQTCLQYILDDKEKEDFLEQCNYNDTTPEEERELFDETSHIYLQAERANLDLDKINDHIQIVFNLLDRIPATPKEEIVNELNAILDLI